MKEKITVTYKRVWDAHYAELKRFCLCKLRYDQALAEDCCQEAFRAYWEYLRKGQPIENVRAWLYKVAGNEVKKVQKQLYERQDELPFEELIGSEPFVNPDYLENILGLHFSDEELLQLLKDTLTSDEQAIFEGCYVNDEKADVLAERLNLSKNHLYKKKSILKKKLKQRVGDVLESSLKLVLNK